LQAEPAHLRDGQLGQPRRFAQEADAQGRAAELDVPESELGHSGRFRLAHPPVIRAGFISPLSEILSAPALLAGAFVCLRFTLLQTFFPSCPSGCLSTALTSPTAVFSRFPS